MKSENAKIARIFLFISISFSMFFFIESGFSNTQYVEFTIFIDRTAPEHSNESITSETLNDSSEEINISAYWTDNRALSHYYFETNITGSFVNSSEKSFNDSWSNETIKDINPEYEGRNVSYRFYSFDRVRNMNQTEYKFFSILNQAPKYYNESQSIDSIAQGENITLSAYWTDNFNVKNATLQFDFSGWQDNETMGINSTNAWSNFTINTTIFEKGFVNWRIISFDSIGNFNATESDSFEVI